MSFEVFDSQLDKIELPSLKEFYISNSCNDDSRKFNISFFFDGTVPTFCDLDVLWIETKNSLIYLKQESEHKSIQKLMYTKLYLINVTFEDKLGQDLLDNLQMCQSLAWVNCTFNYIDESSAFDGLQSLNSLEISNTNRLFDALVTNKRLHSSLKYLKLTQISSNDVYAYIFNLKVINHLVISKMNLMSQHKTPECLFPRWLNKLEVTECKLATKYFLSQIQSEKTNIYELCLLDNWYDVFDLPKDSIKSLAYTINLNITRLTWDKTLLYLFLQSQGKISLLGHTSYEVNFI